MSVDQLLNNHQTIETNNYNNHHNNNTNNRLKQIGMDIDHINDHHKSDDANADGDGDGVWSPDIEQCFHEAQLLYPPCGRRKHILQEEGGGRMYGRNELIARYIMMRTGKSRTRKQVSSHIQVLARRKLKADVSSTGSGASSSPTGISRASTQSVPRFDDHSQQPCYYDKWDDRPIVTQSIRLVEFSAFIEHRNFHTTTPNGLVNNNATIQPPSTTTTINPISALVDTSIDQRDLRHQDNQLQQTNHMQNPFLQVPKQEYQPNHHQNLPTQFNQVNNSYQQATNQVNNLQKSLSMQNNNGQCIATNPASHYHQPHQSSTGVMRHSYVQIDYTHSLGRQTNKLEKIDVSQIQDKFPGLAGPDGLFQHGPSDAFFLVKFWADLDKDYDFNMEDQNSYFGFSSHFETIHPFREILCSTKACSYGLQVVEKVEKIPVTFNNINGRYSYNVNRSPMCEFMIQFIKKLRQLPRRFQMNSVLENFTILQVITSSESSSDILLCLAYVFEVASNDQNNGPHHHVYKLTKD